MLLYAAFRGAVDLANGRQNDARVQFQRAMAGKDASPATLAGELGMVDAELAVGDAAAAVQQARAALSTAGVMQGGLPYSFRTGLAWLSLGRAAQQLGDRALARKALQTSIIQLSNTVDANHPALLQATHLISVPGR
jgi:hypothetical protein